MKLEDYMDEFDVTLCSDNYGQNMTESSLADWLELAALHKVHSPWSDVVDRWGDAGIGQFGSSGIIPKDSSEPETLDYYALAHSEIEVRSSYLDDKYPFTFDDTNSLNLKPGFDITDSFYIDCLCVSLLKGFRISGSGSLLNLITSYFELLVNASVASRIEASGGWSHLKTTVMGTSSDGGPFDDRLRRAADILGLFADPTTAPRSSKAKDDGVDVISGIVWGDNSRINELFLVQAACGKSSEWREKLDRVHSPKWAQYFSELAEPRSVIAIPYHVTDRALNMTIDFRGNHSYLDRLRLVDLAGRFIPAGNEVFKEKRADVVSAVKEELGLDLRSTEQVR